MAARLARFVVNTRFPLSPARMQSTAVAGNATEKLDIGTRIIAGASLLWCSSVLGTVSHLVVYSSCLGHCLYATDFNLSMSMHICFTR